MRRFSSIGIAILIGVLFSPAAWGADVAKIGIVDLQRILDNSHEGKKAQAAINKKGQEIETQLKEKGDALQESQKQFEREKLVLNEKQRREKEREIERKINTLQAIQQVYVQKFKAFEQRFVARIQAAVVEIVEEIGKKEGYLLIIERKQGGIFYRPMAIDITDRVILEYNARAAKKNETIDDANAE